MTKKADKMTSELREESLPNQFIDKEPPLLYAHKEGEECEGCSNCFIPNPKFKGYTNALRKKS